MLIQTNMECGEVKGKTYPNENMRAFNSEWVQGDLVTSGEDRYIHPKGQVLRVEETGICRLVILRKVIPESVGVCVGMRDINGKYICTNDIVQIEHRIHHVEKEENKIPRRSYGCKYEEYDYSHLGAVKLYDFVYYRNYKIDYKNGSVIAINGSDQHPIDRSYIYNHKVKIIGNVLENESLLKYPIE